MEQSEQKLTCPQCQGPLVQGESVCQSCRNAAEDGLEHPENTPLADESENPTNPAATDREDDSLDSPRGEQPMGFDLEKMENGVPWNAVLLGMMVLFLLVTFFNK